MTAVELYSGLRRAGFSTARADMLCAAPASGGRTFTHVEAAAEKTVESPLLRPKISLWTNFLSAMGAFSRESPRAMVLGGPSYEKQTSESADHLGRPSDFSLDWVCFRP